MHTIKSEARRTARRTDSSESNYRWVPYAYSQRCSVSSTKPVEPARISEEPIPYSSNQETTRELSPEEIQGAGKSTDPYVPPIVASPLSSRQATGASIGGSTAYDPNSPATSDKQMNGSDELGSKAEYYNTDLAMSESQTTPVKTSRFRRLFGKGTKTIAADGANSDKEEPKKAKKHYGFMEQVKVVLFGSWLNVLLVCVPIGIAIANADVNPYASFAINFVAIMPLAGILSFATEELALRVGETLGGLLNASFGNAVELIVSVIALFQNKILIVQTSLIGSILSNLLLVLGMCFFFGGFKRLEQFFNTTVAQTSASLLALAVGTLLIPTTFKRFGTQGSADQREAQIPKLSRGLAVILLLTYIAFLFFQLKSHSTMFSNTGGEGSARPVREEENKSKTRKRLAKMMHRTNASHAGGPLDGVVTGETEQKPHEASEECRLSMIGAIITLCVATALIGITSEYMVDGVTPLAEVISPEFIGLILIPIVGNAAEHFTAVTVAIKDKMDLAIGVAVGSSMQIALFVLPLLVVIGWIADKPAMNLEFDGFLLAVLFVSVLLVNYLISDGASHWLEGFMLMALYVIIATAAFLYPADACSVAGPGEQLMDGTICPG